MMGRQILGAIPVERRVLLIARVEARGHAALEGRTVAEVLRPGRLRVLAVDTSAPDDPGPDAAGAAVTPPPAAERTLAQLVHELGDDYVLRPQDRVLLVATRQGLGDLHVRNPCGGRGPAEQGPAGVTRPGRSGRGGGDALPMRPTPRRPPRARARGPLLTRPRPPRHLAVTPQSRPVKAPTPRDECHEGALTGSSRRPDGVMTCV